MLLLCSSGQADCLLGFRMITSLYLSVIIVLFVTEKLRHSPPNL